MGPGKRERERGGGGKFDVSRQFALGVLSLILYRYPVLAGE